MSKTLLGRLACPVCLGVKMEKIRLGSNPHIELDVCRRCGGLWFDAGEIARLRRLKPEALWAHIKVSPDDYRMKCHQCASSMKRNEAKCPACGWNNTLACPNCRKGLTRVSQDGLTIDVCRTCRGAWFDNIELAEIWNRQVTALQARRPGTRAATVADPLMFDMVFWGAYSAAHLPTGAAVGAVVEGTGELAGSVFDALGDLIAKVFEVLGDLTG